MGITLKGIACNIGNIGLFARHCIKSSIAVLPFDLTHTDQMRILSDSDFVQYSAIYSARRAVLKYKTNTIRNMPDTLCR